MSDPRTACCWRSRHVGQPLRAWTRPQLDAFAAALGGAWAGWADAWGLRPFGSDVACEAASDGAAQGSDWICLGAAPGGGAWITVPASIEGAIARGLFEVDVASTPVVRAVVSACRADLLARTAAAFRVEQKGLPGAPPQWGAWSGSLLARGLAGVQVLAEAEVVVRVTGPAPHAAGAAGAQRESLVPITQALAHRRIALQVLLAGCDLEIGTLHALRPGDVLPTGHALSLPAEVRTAGGERLFAAHLVRKGDLRAIALAGSATDSGR